MSRTRHKKSIKNEKTDRIAYFLEKMVFTFSLTPTLYHKVKEIHNYSIPFVSFLLNYEELKFLSVVESGHFPSFQKRKCLDLSGTYKTCLSNTLFIL